MKKEKIHGLTMIAGLLLAVAMVFSNVPLLSEKINPVSEIKAGKDQKEKEVLSYDAAPASILPSVFHVHLSVETYCLFEIAGEDTQTDEEIPACKFVPRKFLTTLFRVIISPNAP